MAGERGLHRDLRGLEVADLADHDDVRVLAQEGAQGRGEVEADLLVHLHLVDARQVELDRVLGGGEVLRGLVQIGERRVERGGLARAGGARHQHHAEGLVDAVQEDVELRLLEAELGHVELQVRLVEEAHHDLLAEQRREHRDAEVHLPAAPHLELDAAVLREPALGDVELGHDLHARGDRVLELHRRLHRLVEHAVDPVAHAEGLLVGLDVDVRCALLDRLRQHQVHELDDGSVLGFLGERVDVDVVRVVDEVDVRVVEVPHHLFERGGLVVVLLDRAPDRLLGRDHRLDVVSGEELDVVEREDVGGIGGRQDQRRARPVDGDHGVLDRDLLGDQLDHGGLDLELVEIDRGHAVLLGDEIGELVLVQEAELGDLRAEPTALRAGLLARLAQLLRAEEVLLDEKLPDPLVHA